VTDAERAKGYREGHRGNSKVIDKTPTSSEGRRVLYKCRTTLKSEQLPMRAVDSTVLTGRCSGLEYFLRSYGSTSADAESEGEQQRDGNTKSESHHARPRSNVMIGVKEGTNEESKL
jgi:hypothetical protein